MTSQVRLADGCSSISAASSSSGLIVETKWTGAVDALAISNAFAGVSAGVTVVTPSLGLPSPRGRRYANANVIF
jgi:hypothetical protein